jgi:heterodisulfide reductase subunit A-like polyferredoxin
LTEALEKGVEFVGLKDSAALVPRGTSAEISTSPGAAGGAPLTVTFRRDGAGAKDTLNADYVVLSAGLRPSPESKALAEVLGLDVDSNGFLKELHPELRPVETPRMGVYICGLAHSPQTVQETIAQAMAAAKKASAGLRHPRS